MKNFDYKRCLQVIKWNIIANKKKLINITIGMIAAVVIVHCLNSGMLWSDNVNAVVVSSTSNLLMAIGTIYFITSAARINFNMQKKGDIINYAMLPATKQEKFWANWFMQVPFLFVMLIVALIAGDLVQMFISFLLHGDAYVITSDVLATSLPAFLITHESFLGNIMSFLGMSLFHATFLYGGVLFRRHPVLLTVVCWIVIPMILGTVFTGLAAAFAYFMRDANYDITVEWLVSPNTFNIIAKVVTMLAELGILVLLYWLTYRKFCKTQVINNRFFN